jgi:putative DNA primase/helicase
MSEQIKVTARKLRKAGFSVVLIDSKTRVPYGTWKEYQTDIISEDELNKRLERYNPDAVQVVCGSVSGLKPGYGLLVLDFDDPVFFVEWVKIVGKETVLRFPIDKTGRGGYHVYIRCPNVGRKDVLAYKSVPTEVEKSGRKGTIEYLGEGCTSIVAPSMHKNGNQYTHVSQSASSVPYITEEEADILIDAARSLDQCPLTIQDSTRLVKEKKRNRPLSEDRDGSGIIERWNREYAVEDILERYGYSRHQRVRNRMVRPNGGSPSVCIIEGQSFHHSANDDLADGHLHDAFDVFCRFEHNGDVRLAVKDAAFQLGIPYKPMEERRAEVMRDVMQELMPGYKDDPESGTAHVDKNGMMFKPLGYFKKTHFYLPYRFQQVIELSAANHTPSQLLLLAPANWWQKNFMTALNRRTVDWEMATNALFNANSAVGPFNPDLVRGCGAWIDKKRVIVHEGNRLIVDKTPTSIPEFEGTDYIYERRAPLLMWDGDPMCVKEANKLMQLCERFMWEKPIDARLFAGWIFLANMCGALRWRPHLWISGEAGSGKTTVVYSLAKKLLGRACLGVQATTSEAGIRQRLKHDAFPIIFDEIDTQTLRDQDRVKALLELARQSSSDTEGELIKGSTSGDAVTYKIRSMFCFASIKTHIEQAADASRITVLNMMKPTREYNDANWNETKRIIDELTEPEWSSRFRSRGISLIRNVLENVEVISEALSHRFSQRVGDQLGSLLAGAYSGYYSNGVITPRQADEWIDRYDFSDQSTIAAQRDDTMCLKTILESRLTVSTDTARLERTVEELIIAAGDSMNTTSKTIGVSDTNANITLMRYGIKYDSDRKLVWISKSHNGIKRLLSGTPWPVRWGDLLRRIEGAQEYDHVRYHRVNHAAVGIPISAIFEYTNDAEYLV